jgi:WD40 repeat protein
MLLLGLLQIVTSYIGGSDGTVTMWRFPGECFKQQRLHRPDHMVYALAGQKDGKHLWSGGEDQRLKQWVIKDYAFTWYVARTTSRL